MAGKSRRVVVATPTVERPFPAYLESLEASAAALDAAGWEHSSVFEIGCPYIAAARAKMLRKALDAQADVVVFIDHDVEWHPSDLIRLIETPGDVVAGLYRFKKEPVEYMGVICCDQDGYPKIRQDGCIEALRVPAGFLKVTKEAVDRLMRAYPELLYGPAYAPSIDLFNHGAKDGVMWGEDYAFSNRWRDCGGDIWVVPDLDLAHHGKDQAYPGNYHDFLTRQPGGVNAPA